jgi:hypothetical protein
VKPTKLWGFGLGLAALLAIAVAGSVPSIAADTAVPSTVYLPNIELVLTPSVPSVTLTPTSTPTPVVGTGPEFPTVTPTTQATSGAAVEASP